MTTTPLTEADVLSLLRARYGETVGNGAAWAFMTHVRDAAGFDALGTADAIAMALWPSRHLELIGHEVKVTRGDWHRELKHPEKAARFTRHVDRWYIVAPPGIVQPGELPDHWGLLEAHPSRLIRRVTAPPLHPHTRRHEPISRSFVAALLRSAAKTPR